MRAGQQSLPGWHFLGRPNCKLRSTKLTSFCTKWWCIPIHPCQQVPGMDVHMGASTLEGSLVTVSKPFLEGSSHSFWSGLVIIRVPGFLTRPSKNHPSAVLVYKPQRRKWDPTKDLLVPEKAK